MLTDWQRAKAQHFFAVFDTDHDGYLEAADLERVVAKLGRLRTDQAGARHTEQLRKRWRFVWNRMAKVADSNRDGLVTPDEFLRAYERSLGNRVAYSYTMSAIGRMNFDILDANGDGRISLPEYEAFYRAHDLDASQAAAIFARLDTDHDGSITRREGLRHLRDFFKSDDRTRPGNWFFGSFEALPAG
jgi:Ca2+-binding EF-hand superfamily protein